MSSIRAEAEKLAAVHTGDAGYELERRKLLSAAVEKALRDERERAAKIAEKSHQQPCICTTCLIHAEIAAAIRKED